jgi:hypothetical protein
MRDQEPSIGGVDLGVRGTGPETLAGPMVGERRARHHDSEGQRPDVDQFFTPQIKRTTAKIGELQKAMERVITSNEGKALIATVAVGSDFRSPMARRNTAACTHAATAVRGGPSAESPGI